MGLLKGLLRIFNWLVDRVGGALGAIILGGALSLLLVDAKILLGLSSWLLIVTVPVIWAMVGLGALLRPRYLSLFFLPTLIVLFFDEAGDVGEAMEFAEGFLCLAYLVSLVLIILGSILQSPVLLLCGAGILLAYAVLTPGVFSDEKQAKRRR